MPLSVQDLWIALVGAGLGSGLTLIVGTRPAPVVTILAAVVTGVGFVLLRRSLVLELATLTIVGGILQGIATTVSPVQASLLLDDAPFILLVIALLPLILRHAVRLLAPLAVLTLLVAVAVLRSTDLSVGVFQARQVMIPPLLMLAGYLVARRDWRRFNTATIALAVCTAIYCIIEVLGWRPIDPTPSLAANAHATIYISDGLPGYYYYFGLSSEPYVRAGGPLLNPPSTGLFLGTATVVAFWTLRGRWQWALTAVLMVATVSTISRAGLLIAVAGLGGPWLVRHVSMRVTLSIAAVSAALAGFLLSRQAGSGAHLGGLVDGLHRAIAHPWGYGFGHNGNIAKDAGLTAHGESLLGVALAAIGLPVLAGTVWLAARLVVRFYGTPDALVWNVFVGAAALAVAATAETASGLDASVPMWMLTGLALSFARPPRGSKSQPRASRLRFWPPTPSAPRTRAPS